jgi:hypothetical protein
MSTTNNLRRPREPVYLSHEMVRHLIALEFGPFNIVHLVALLAYGWPVRGGQA